MGVPFSCCCSATGVRFLVIRCPLGNWASLTVGLPALQQDRTPTGLSRSTRTSSDRGGRPLNPGDSGAHTTGPSSPVATCRITAATSLNPDAASIVRGFT